MNQTLPYPHPLRRVGLTREQVIEMLGTRPPVLDEAAELPVRENRHYTAMDRVRVREMLAAGIPRRMVARELGLTPKAVSYLRKQADE